MKREISAPLKQIAVRLLDRIELSSNRQALSCVMESLDKQSEVYALNSAAKTEASPLPQITPGSYDNLLASTSQAMARIMIARAKRPNFSTLHL